MLARLSDHTPTPACVGNNNKRTAPWRSCNPRINRSERACPESSAVHLRHLRGRAALDSCIDGEFANDCFFLRVQSSERSHPPSTRETEGTTPLRRRCATQRPYPVRSKETTRDQRRLAAGAAQSAN